MATIGGSGVYPLPKIESLPNLRLLCKRSTSSVDTTALLDAAALYRSSKPDRLALADLDKFRKLDIKCIIDFRSEEEYNMVTDEHRLLDKEYALYKVILPKDNYKPEQSVKYELVQLKECISTPRQNEQLTKPDEQDVLLTKNTDNIATRDIHETLYNQKEDLPEKRHFLINFFSMKYVKTVFNRLPWHLWCLGLLHLMWDIVTWNKLKTFRKFIATKAISTSGIFGQYVDIIEVSQPAICTALKLIADSENLPALINCAFGKDRTGIMSALILTFLGMPQEYVVEEYAMSTEGLEPIKHQMYKHIVETHHLREEFCTSEPNTIRDLLTYIEDRYKSVEQYMVSIGFSEEEQMKLKNNLEAFNHKSQK